MRVLLFLLLSRLALASHLHHEEIERDYHPKYLERAYGEINARATVRYDWPVQVLSIGHTMASYQNYGMGLQGAYFHHGIDIRANSGSNVLASVGGRVINIENYMAPDPAYWEIAILDDEGFIWQYHHVEPSSIPQAIKNAFQSGARIEAGTKIGEVYSWPITTFGERFHHIHLNVLGAGKAYLDGFQFLQPIADTVAPKILEVGLFKNGKLVPGNRVTGAYTVAARIEDLVLSPVFTVPPYEVTIAIDNQFPQTVWRFETLPGGESNTKYLHDFFIPELTCGNYQCRKIYINLGFELAGIPRFPTTVGNYRATIEARDTSGNRVEREFSWEVY